MIGRVNWALILLGMFSLGEAQGGDQPRTGFLDRVFKGPNGYSAKYVVFIPRGYDGKKTFPTILFLHGSGATGTDGRAPVKGALAAAIRKQEKKFTFIAVFPQAHEGSWQADSKDGKRALAILDQVAKDFRVDAHRVYLTGLSMGGEGTWSLAAAHPQRWAAIVPICGGGDPKSAAKFKDVPCWCFHGDADKVIPPEQSREMIRALKKVGGRPLYHEYPGVGHNSWDRTYAMPDLFEWLLLQMRK
jgi:predicted peptidase